ncbi:hypothetical protein MYX06_05290 [Patescibacteria group bacterium AH-259-L05]|nr:hypothetical protein [Patescibacteria group bacterium AH-259-L05]
MDTQDEIKALKEKIRKLEARLHEKKEGTETESAAEGTLREVGSMFGLGGLIEKLGKSPAFKQRLSRVDKEIERKFKEEPLKRTGEEKKGGKYGGYKGW